jgi:hypothetical protein
MISAKKFGTFDYYSYLCVIKHKVMEEKRNPILEEKESVGMACEPAVGAATAFTTYDDGGMSYGDDIASDEDLDKLDWDKFPSFGPFSKEEAIARIEEAERDLEDPSKWISSEDAWKQLYEKYPWLR